MLRAYSGQSGDGPEHVGASLDEAVASLRVVTRRYASALAEIDADGPDPDAGVIALLGYFARESTWVGLLMGPQGESGRGVLLEVSGQQDVPDRVSPLSGLFGFVVRLHFSDGQGLARLTGISGGGGDQDPRDDISCVGVVDQIELFAREAATDMTKLAPEEIGVAAKTAKRLHTPMFRLQALDLLRHAVHTPS